MAELILTPSHLVHVAVGGHVEVHEDSERVDVAPDIACESHVLASFQERDHDVGHRAVPVAGGEPYRVHVSIGGPVIEFVGEDVRFFDAGEFVYDSGDLVGVG